MTNKSKIAMIATVAVLGMASPALAQDVYGSDGAPANWNVPTQSYQAPTQDHQFSAHRSGLQSFARVPQQEEQSSDQPALRMDREDF
jgi:hypothetical protein